MILEYHDTKDTVEVAKEARVSEAEERQAKFEEALGIWLTERGKKGSFDLEKEAPPETEYIVNPDIVRRNVNVLHDHLVNAKIYPEGAESGDHFMRFTFPDGTDIAAARRIIEG